MGEELVPREEVVQGEVLGGTVEFIREVDGFTGEACLVKQNGKYFIVSSTYAMFSGFETLIFPANEAGQITSWGEVGGGRGMSREEAIRELELSGPYVYGE